MGSGSTRKSTKYRGVYQRESAVRRHQGRPDICFDIAYRDVNNRLVWEKIGWQSEGYSAAMASQVRSERLRAQRHGDVAPVARRRGVPTLSQAWDRYREEWLLTETKHPEKDINRWENHLAPLGQKALTAVTPEVLDQLRAKLRKRDLSPQTITHVLSLLRRVMLRARRWGMWSGPNPFEDYKMPQVNNERFRFLTVAEAEMLLEAVCGLGYRMATYRICLTSLHTGMRAGEIHALRWEQVDLANLAINIADSKSGMPRQTIITPRLAASLEAQRGETGGAGLVFPGNEGKERREVSKAFSRKVEELGFNAGITDRRGRVVFHSLRHTFASWLAMAGVPLYQIAGLLGHTTVEMTRRYAHLCPQGVRRAVGQVEALFGATAGHASS